METMRASSMAISSPCLGAQRASFPHRTGFLARRPAISWKRPRVQGPFSPKAALSDADTAAICATVFAGAVTSACWWLVSSRVSATIDTRNLRTSVSAQLQEAQLQLLNDSVSPEDARELKLKVLKLKVLLKKMEEEAEQGRAIQGRNQVPTLTPLVYLRKSLWSMKQIGNRNRASLDLEGEAAGARANIASGVTLAIMVLLLMTHSFLP